MPDSMTRRRALIGTGTLAAALTGSIALSSSKASATVSGDFAIPDAERVLADQQLTDVRLSCQTDWGYQSNAEVHGIELELHAGATTDTLDLIARHENTDLGTDNLTGEETLNGSLMSTSDFAIEDFQPTSGELNTPVVAEVRFYVIRDGDVIAEAKQTATFEVTVRNEELQVDMTLAGEGEVLFETD